VMRLSEVAWFARSYLPVGPVTFRHRLEVRPCYPDSVPLYWGSRMNRRAWGSGRRAVRSHLRGRWRYTRHPWRRRIGGAVLAGLTHNCVTNEAFTRADTELTQDASKLFAASNSLQVLCVTLGQTCAANGDPTSQRAKNLIANLKSRTSACRL
jgi:hypothetical protein